MEKYTFVFVVEGTTERNYIKDFEKKYLKIRNSSTKIKLEMKVDFDVETHKDCPSSKSIAKSLEIVHNYNSAALKNNTYYFFILDVESAGNDKREEQITTIKKEIASKNGCLDRMVVCESNRCFEVFKYINHNTFKPSSPIAIKDMYNKDMYAKLDMPVKADATSILKISKSIKNFNKKFNTYETYTNMDKFFDKILELKLISSYDDLELNT